MNKAEKGERRAFMLRDWWRVCKSRPASENKILIRKSCLQTRKKLRKTGESIVGLLLANGLMLWRRVWAANEPEPSEIRLKMTEPCELVCKPALALKKVNTALYSWNSNKEASSRFYVQFNRD